MCGRYVQASSPTLLAAHFGIEEIRIPEPKPDDEPYPQYNVAPRSEMPIVAVSSGRRVLDRVRWGLVPYWADDIKIGDRQINARAESVATKPAFRRAFEKRRCIVPADGFYEWQAIEGRKQKQPWFIHRTDGEPFAFAGLWERWGEDDLRTFAIITTEANDTLTPIHHRMPVVLPESQWDRWLDPAFRDTAALQDVLVPLPDAEVEAWPVSTLVNKADNDTPDLTTRVEVASA
ncbi:MAG: SOS response-associated peptidase [Actinomycetota bacterium]|nr:SOS response-associated peptidase [Actinomycetota bacterium]